MTSVFSRASPTSSPLAYIAGFSAGEIPEEALSRAQQPMINDDAANTLIGITCMLLVLCTAAVVGRILARRSLKLRLEADDYLALLALVSSAPIFQGYVNSLNRFT